MSIEGDFKDYIKEYSKYANWRPDQTVIIKREFLPFIKEFKYSEEVISFPSTEEWYPLVNSYYPFTEDVDAYARVNHLLEKRPSYHSMASQSSAESVDKVDCYSEKLAQRQYLESKPFCFLILGKPGLGEENLGRRLAEFWKCVYIDPQILLEEEINSGSRAGDCIEFNLRCGRAIGVDVIMRLLTKRIQRPDVHHRGFVLCGFPLIPNELYEEDPISSETAIFNVREIFEELIDTTIDLADASGKVQVSLMSSSKDPSLADQSIEESPDDILNEIEIKLSMGSTSIHSDICGTQDISTDFIKQLNIIFGLFVEPFIIIYLHCGNEEVVSKRDHYYYDIYSKRSLDMQKVKLFNEIGAANEDLTRDLFEIGINPFSENPNLRHIVKVPENFPANVSAQLDRYHSNVANEIDNRVLLHDIQYYIKLDGRSFISKILDSIKLRLKVLPVSKVLIPQRLNISFDVPGPEDEAIESLPLSLDEAFQKFSKSQIAAPQYKWTWSEWRKLCPVSMFRGEYKKGNPNFAVQFMSRLFFLSDEESYSLFRENPRPYLLPPFPKPGNRILIFGPPFSGKSALARCLAYYLDLKAITLSSMQREFMNQKLAEEQEKIKQMAITEALKLLEERKRKELEEKRAERVFLIEKWENTAFDVLDRVFKHLERSDNVVSSLFKLSSFPIRLEQGELGPENELEDEDLRYELIQCNLPTRVDKNVILELKKNRDVLMGYLPEHLKGEVTVDPATVLDPFVLDFADRKVAEMDMEEFEASLQHHLYDAYALGIKSVARNHEQDGWIIDGMTLDVNLLAQIFEEFSPNEVIILNDSPDYTFITEKFKAKPPLQAFNYRDFFLKLHEDGAAFRCPSTCSNESYRMQVAREIIDEILKTDQTEEELLKIDEKSLHEFELQLKEFSEGIPLVRKLLEGIDIEAVEVTVTALPTEELLKNVIKAFKDKYQQCASEFTDIDRAEEVQALLIESGPTGGEGEGKGESLMGKRQYGDTNMYCPVNFCKHFVLWKGKEQFAAKFKNKIYLMATQEDLDEFLKRPREFLRLTNPPVRFPPPRICIVGPKGSGKSTVAKALSVNLGIRRINFQECVKQEMMSFSSAALFVRASEHKHIEEVPDTFAVKFVEKFIDKLWFEEPLKKTGFVIDNFPETLQDMELMIEHRAIPDIIIHIACSREYINRKLLETELEDWLFKREEAQQWKKDLFELECSQWQERRDARYKELMEMKKETRYSLQVENVDESTQDAGSEKETVKVHLASDTQISVDSVAEQQDETEVLKILNEEFPEPVFEEDDEWNEEKRAKSFSDQIEESYEIAMDSAEKIRELCENELINWREIDGKLSTTKSMIQAFIASDEVKFRNESMFEICFDVSLELAAKLLEQGYFFLSRFGKTCPVQVVEDHNKIQMYLCCEKTNDLFPVIHKHYIYFLAGKKNYEKFVKNPLKYLNWPSAKFPLTPMRMAVIGPPKSGKSTVASRFNQRLGFVKISRGGALRNVKKNLPFANLTKAVESCLRKGQEPSMSMVMESVQAEAFNNDGDCQGLVFDGFPNSVQEMNEMLRLGLLPHLIFDLQATDEEVFKLAAIPIQSQFPLYSKRFIEHLLKQWGKNAKQFRNWCDREYQSIYKLTIEESIWGTFEKCKDVALAATFERRHYYAHAHSDWPLRLAYMLVTPLEFLERQSRYKTYCPVCLHHSRSFRNGGDPPDRTGLVHFRQYFYWICKEHIEEFLAMPEAYIPPNNILLPQELPEVIHLKKPPANVMEDGLCLVCYLDNLPRKVLQKGSYEFAAMYAKNVYLFDCQKCLDEFMENPRRFTVVTINFRREIDYSSMSLDYNDLPVLGMLEQYLASQITKAVSHANFCRPVIPGLSISASALICIGLFLKVRNPKTPDQYVDNYKKALDLFHQRRKDFLRYLERMKEVLNPHLRYCDPEIESSGDSSSVELKKLPSRSLTDD